MLVFFVAGFQIATTNSDRLQAAEKYAEERQKLFDALIEIRETIGEASSKTKSFQQESEISKCAEVLYEAIVTAIQKSPTESKKPPKPNPIPSASL